MLISGTVNTIGGGLGGTSMVDNNPFTPGGTSITPVGGYFGGRQVASGNAAAPAISGSGILQVHVVAGGAGGGVANITVHGTAGNDVNVGVASGAAGAAGNWAMPVVYASGMYATVNAVIGAANIVGLAGSTHIVGSVRTTGAGGSIGALNIGGSVGALGIGGSVGALGIGGSIGVTQITTPWVTVGSMHLSNAADIGGGFASAAVYGSPAFPVYNVGTTHISNVVNTVGSQFVVGRGGSMGVTPIGDFTVWLANAAAGSGFASVAVYGSPAMPVYNIGTVHVSNFAAGTGFATAAVYGSPAFPVYAVGSVHIVNAGDIGGGTGFASVAVYGSPGMPVYNVGTVHVSNMAAGSGFASVAVYGSPAMPVYVIGSANVVGGGGSMGAVNLGGSVGVTQITSPWIVTGSAGVTPLATFTVALDKIPTVNLGLGTVNVGNIVTATLPAVTVVDARGSLVPTQWIISGAASGQFVVAGSAPANLRVYFSSFHLVAEGTVDMRWMSPSGVAMTGSMRLLPGAGFGLAGAIQQGPVAIGSLQSAIYIHSSGTQNIGGVAVGYVAP